MGRRILLLALLLTTFVSGACTYVVENPYQPGTWLECLYPEGVCHPIDPTGSDAY
jgi:hypothetical protein